MRKIFGFRQLEALAKGLDLIDLYLLEYILYIYAEDKNKITIKNKIFSKIDYLELTKELPILKLETKKAISARFLKLERKELIKRFVLRNKEGVSTLVMPDTKEIFKIV